MHYKIVFLLMLLSPTYSFSQNQTAADSANQIIKKGGDCDDKTFTRVENLPSLKIPQAAFEDTISLYLRSKKGSHKSEYISFQFVIDCHGQIRGLISRVDGSARNEADLKEAIQKYSYLWLPAIQNNYIVSSYVKLDMECLDDKVKILIKQ